MFVVSASPVQGFADNHSQAQLEPDFIASLPSACESSSAFWEFRRLCCDCKNKGRCTTRFGDLTPRDRVINLNFLGAKPYPAEICSDAINADKAAVDYSIHYETLNIDQSLKIHLTAGGEYVAKLIPKDQ
jgi:alpha-glucosidase